MRALTIRNAIRISAASLPLLAGCASMRSPTPQRIDYGAEAFARIRDSIMGAPERAEARDGEPRVKITTPSVLGADRYVDASIRVSEDAYVVVVASDFDGRYRVVFPESPEESGFVRAGAPHKLSKFFAGFGSAGLAQVGRSAFSIHPVGTQGTRGALVAIASARPLQLSRITEGGVYWSETELERVLRYLSAPTAAYALGRELSLVGQEFDVDYSGFVQSAGAPMYALARYGSSMCESEQTGSLYYDGRPPTRFYTSDGMRYATVTLGDACSGYVTRTVPIGPADAPMPRDSAAAAGTGVQTADRLTASRRATGLGVDQLDDVTARARRSSPMSTDDVRPRAERPEVGLRFRPPEQVRAEPRLRGEANEGWVRRAADVDKHRAVRESGERRAPRAEPVRREAPRPEPSRAEPSAPRAERAAPAANGKPTKEN